MSMMISLFLLQAATAQPTTAAPAASPPDDAKIVCKTINATGSRIGGKRVCLPKREWKRMHDQGRETASAYQDHQNKQPGNQ